jgi:hypothetical protein
MKPIEQGRTMNTTLDLIENAEEDLLSRAFLYNHPVSFREGVEASMQAVRALLAKTADPGARSKVVGRPSH